MTSFEYYEIRPCIDVEGETMSFFGKMVEVKGENDWQYTPENALKEAEEAASEHNATVFWTIYGRHTVEGALVATAIGNFSSFEVAYDVMQAILLPIRRAIDKIENHWRLEGLEDGPDGICDLDDILMQSTNRERL